MIQGQPQHVILNRPRPAFDVSGRVALVAGCLDRYRRAMHGKSAILRR